MSEKANSESTGASSWKALQIQLGLASEKDFLPEESPPAEEHKVAKANPPGSTTESTLPESSVIEAKPPVERPRQTVPPTSAEPPAADDVSKGFGAGILETVAEETRWPEPLTDKIEEQDLSPAETNGEHEVEMGEAPEEVPDAEPEPEEEKRQHRRKRGRRRRKFEAESQSAGAVSASDERELLDESGVQEKDGEDAAASEDDDSEEGEVDMEPFADWNVPSWQELIASLYRPER
jgi:hypothetical protein